MYVHGSFLMSFCHTYQFSFRFTTTISSLPLPPPPPLPVNPNTLLPSPLSSWINDWSALITSEEPAKDVAGAEALLARHAEHKAEIDEREKTFQTFNEMGKSLNFKGHFAAREVNFHNNE